MSKLFIYESLSEMVEEGDLGLAFVVGYFLHVLIIWVFAFWVFTVVCRHSYRIRLPPHTKEKRKSKHRTIWWYQDECIDLDFR